MKRNKQGESTILPISTKQTISSLLKSSNTIPRHLQSPGLEKAGINLLMGFTGYLS
jgi:hypothetical protein